MVKICQKCRTPAVDDQSQYCTKCGTQFSPIVSESKSNERSFIYSKKFYVVLGSDVLLSFFIALGGIGSYIEITNQGYHSPIMLFLVSVSFINLILDGTLLIKSIDPIFEYILPYKRWSKFRVFRHHLLSNKKKHPNVIDIRLCWLKCLFGLLGIFTILSGLYFIIISINMDNAYKARRVPNKQDVRIESNKGATSGNPLLCSNCGAAIEQYSAYCPECKTILLYEKAEAEKAAKLRCDITKENIVRLQDSGDIQLIQNFANRYPNYDDQDQKFFNLNALLAKKGYKFTTSELLGIIREVKLQDELEKIKMNVLQTNPKTPDDFIKNYIKLFGYPDIQDNAFNFYNIHPDQIHNSLKFLKIHCITQLLKDLFDYQGNLREDLVRLRKDIELERFEKKLIGDQSLRITINDVDNISGYDFEIVLKALFEKMEYNVTHTPFSNDQGADLIIEKSGVKTVVQAEKLAG